MRINVLVLPALLLLSGLATLPTVAAAEPGYGGGSKSAAPSRTRTYTPSASSSTGGVLPSKSTRGTPKPSKSTSGAPKPSTSGPTQQPTVSPSPGEELPRTGSSLAVTGVMLAGAGIGFLGAWWLWQSRIHGRTRVRGRGQLDRQPRPRHR